MASFLDLDDCNVTFFKLYIDLYNEIASTSQGSYGALSNRNVLLGYGKLDYIKEFGPKGDVCISISGADLYCVHRAI
jgi:hypothetical protein